jgi:hypothetical protein
MPHYTLSLPGELVRGVEAALGLGLAEPEFSVAEGLVREIVNEDETPNLGAIVTSIEKAAGLALDVPAYAIALAAARRTLAPYPAAYTLAPDAHLDMAFEDQVSGNYTD